jgi:hypothetical protein
MNIKRLDDPTIPVATTFVGLIIYGMQGGQTVKVTPALLDEIVETVNLSIPQALTEGQKAQVRKNINVLSYAVMTEAEFAALPVKNEDVLYLIIEE